EKGAETILLGTEEPLRRIAAAMDVSVTFEAGPDAATEAILARVAGTQDSLQALRSDLAGRGEQIAALEARVVEVEGRVTQLRQQLGGVEEEKSALAQRIEAQARIRERFARVEKMFTREEARVLREGDDVILRLYGLTFLVGRATIEAKYFSLLTKVQQAIEAFPGCRITIEGHTDSFGSDEANLGLSQERADAVRHYLIANMKLDPVRIESLGYGEARPVASNDTQEGRARNRRIDVVIHPGGAGE
ncbi:MAG: OmpA family protein, partial [Gemmatimonadota bacterium]